MQPTQRRASEPSAQSQGRQRMGVACSECRRRKLRCDGKRPNCGNCEQAGVSCQVTARHNPRGPKRGYMAELRKKNAELESRLASQQSSTQQTEPTVLFDPVMDFHSEDNLSDWTDFSVAPLQSGGTSVTASEVPFPDLVPTTVAPSIALTAAPLQQHTLTGFIPAELDQLYFERINPVIPLLHQRRYLSWSKQPMKKNSRICLQHALWTLAALLSAQFQYLHETLYQSTKQMLGAICPSSIGQDSFDKEQIQAWLLITVYELIRSSHQQAWLSAGRAFRLVQLLRLHEIDSPGYTASPDDDFVETEEKRRCFWTAYFLDHLFSVSNNWPVTLSEFVICTRLSAPENEFQADCPVLGNFLSEAINERQPRYPSAFNEAIIFATLCGRHLFNRQQYHARSTYGDVTPHWIDPSMMLDTILKRRLSILMQCYSSPESSQDAMIQFVNIMAQCTIIYSLTGIDLQLRANEGSALREEHQIRAVAAVETIISLARALTESFIFKIHPLTPIPLMLCAEFLFRNQSSSDAFRLRLDGLLKVFEHIRDINNPKQSYIDVMKRWPCRARSEIKHLHSPENNSIS